MAIDFVTREEALQAVLAALMFGQNAGIAAETTSINEVILPGARNLVKLSNGAIRLLRQAQIKIDHQNPRTVGECTESGYTLYDLKDPNRIEVV